MICWFQPVAVTWRVSYDDDTSLMYNAARTAVCIVHALVKPHIIHLWAEKSNILQYFHWLVYVVKPAAPVSEGCCRPLVGAQSIEPGVTSNSGRAQTLLPGGRGILMYAITTKLRWVFISNCFTSVAAFMHRARLCAPASANFNATDLTLIWKVVKQSPH